MNKNHIEYLDPIDSFPQQEARIPLAKPGRYLGFDTWVADGQGTGDIPIRVGHSKKGVLGIVPAQPFSDEANTLQYTGTLVTCQGVVHNRIIDNILIEGIPLSFDSNTGTQDKYWLFYGRYSWVPTAGGSQVEFGIYEFSPTNLEEIDLWEFITSPNIEFPIGYFVIKPNTTDITGLAYYPALTPKFAWSEEAYFDPNLYAKLWEYNEFHMTNYLQLQELNDDNVDTSAWELSFDGDKGNVIDVTLTKPLTALVTINSGNRRTQGVYFFKFSSLAHEPLRLFETGNIKIPPGAEEMYYGARVMNVYHGQTLIMLKSTNMVGQEVWTIWNKFPESRIRGTWKTLDPKVLENPSYIQFDYLEYLKDPFTGHVKIRAQIRQTRPSGIVSGTYNNVANVPLPIDYSPSTCPTDPSTCRMAVQHAICTTAYKQSIAGIPDPPGFETTMAIVSAVLVITPDNTIDLIVQDLEPGTYLFSEFHLSNG